ncbi:MAG TPA: hypothetical protein RMH99_13700 [Sandaracinaceae bacterium LLY-WYZ-13_1]|nr:hypothetical protein [Sandaracinaceae bacterium LLY-WYZ-13_1]
MTDPPARAGAVAAALVGLSLALVSTATAGAQDRAPERAPRVEVTTAGDDTVRRELEAVLADLLATVPVDARFARSEAVSADRLLRPDPNAAEALARVWVDLRGPDRATVYLVDGPWERALVRHVPLGPSGVDEVVREQVGRIVGTAVEAMVAGARLGVTRDEARARLGLPRVGVVEAPPPAADSDDASRATHRSARLRLGVGYELWFFDPELPTHALGARLGWSAPVDEVRLGVRLAGWYRFRTRVEREPVGAVFELGAVRLAGTLAHAPARWVELEASAGVVLQLVHVEPFDVQRTDDVRPAAPSWRTDPALTVEVGATARPFEGLAVGLFAGLDVDLMGARYVVERGGTRVPVFEPAVVRPRVGAFVAADLAL